MHVTANHVAIIPPFSNGFIIGKLAKDPQKRYQLPLQTNKLTPYVITKPGLKTLPWLMDYVQPNQVCIPVHNATAQDMIIERNTFIAEIEIIQKIEDYDIHSMSMTEVPTDVIETNYIAPAFVEPDIIECNHATHCFIQDDEGMNEEEKEEAFLH
jgi:hypothetical protein